MTVEFLPSKACGVAKAPPSKSMTHRALIAAALANDVSTVNNVAPSEDVLATLDCLRTLGTAIVFNGQAAIVTGPAPEDIPTRITLPCRESGTTLRLLIPLALTLGKEITFTGSNHLMSRPLSVFEDICRENGSRFEYGTDHLTVKGRLIPGTYTVPGDVSSQFISGLCFALPLLDGDSRIEILPPVESRPYIEMTVQVLRSFGIHVAMQGSQILIPGRQQFQSREYCIEGDWSNAAFLDAFNLADGSVTVSGLAAETCQGDRVYPALFDELRRGSPSMDLSDCPDLGPVCFALAAALHGGKFTGIKRLRYKESDRIAAMAKELSKFGAVLQVVDADSITVSPTQLHRPELPLYGHNDHRIVMALSVLAAQTGGVIFGAEAVNKSYPDFFDALERLGVTLIRHP